MALFATLFREVLLICFETERPKLASCTDAPILPGASARAMPAMSAQSMVDRMKLFLIIVVPIVLA